MAVNVIDLFLSMAIWGTNATKNAAAKAELVKTGRKVLALQCDVADEKAVETAFAETLRQLGRVDGCFANAGVAGRGSASFVEMATDEEAQQAITQLNDTQFEGRALAVNEARPKPAFAGGGGGGGGYDRGNGGGPRRRSEPRW